MPQVGASTQDSGADPAREQRQRDEQAGHEPDRELEQVRECVGVPVEHEGGGENEAEQSEPEDGGRQCDEERDRMGHVERHVEEQPAPEQRRGQRVQADRRGRDRQGHDDEQERRRHGDRVLEHSLPPLPLDRTAGAEQRRRPDPHHPGAKRDVEERSLACAGLEHEVGDRGEDDRLQDRREDVEARQRQVLHVEAPADPEETESSFQDAAPRQGAMGGCQARTQAAFISTDMDAGEDDAWRRPARPGESASF